jgi:hypothetical protein
MSMQTNLEALIEAAQHLTKQEQQKLRSTVVTALRTATPHYRDARAREGSMARR